MILKGISFHDSTLTSISREGSAICLGLDSVYVNGTLRSAKVFLINVGDMTSQGLPIDDLRMEGDDGEILTLEPTEEGVKLILIWENYKTRSQVTKSYRINCEMNVDISN